MDNSQCRPEKACPFYMSVTILLAFISAASVLIPLSLAVIQWKKIPGDIALLRWILLCSAVSDIALFILALGFNTYNMFVGDIFMFVQFTTLLYILILQFDRKKSHKIAYPASVVLYAVALFFLRNQMDLTWMLHAFMGLILIIVSILFLYKLLSELRIENIHRQPIVWIAFATLFYYSGSLFVFVAFNYLVKTDSLKYAWPLHQILNITKNIFFAVALWQSYRAVKSSA